MIKVDSILITEFRGIKNLQLDFKGRNFAICGPNGTGKSGIVDALEFGLTGKISRLSGEGQGEITLKQHAPHVDSRHDPENATVEIILTILATNKKHTIRRSAKKPSFFELLPDDTVSRKTIEILQCHPEIMLSRRELIRYILATPTKRAEEVQALLHLDQIETVRASLRNISNSKDREYTLLGKSVEIASSNLKKALEVGTLSTESILESANRHRATLGISLLESLSSDTNLTAGLTLASKPESMPSKAQLVLEITNLKAKLANIRKCTTEIDSLIVELEKFEGDPLIEQADSKENFLSIALKLIDDEKCPLCDTEWEIGALQRHIKSKIEQLNIAAKIRNQLKTKTNKISADLSDIVPSVRAIIKRLETLQILSASASLSEFEQTSSEAALKLQKLFPLAETMTTLKRVKNIPFDIDIAIENLEIEVKKLPDESKQDAAKTWLTIAQERLTVLRDAERSQKDAKESSKLAKAIFESYCQTSDRVLTGIYNSVQEDFAALYQSINHDDEANFEAKLQPSMGKLGFDVDFYGRGFFPPGAYHSEGHQDGMGICLYLALMKYLQAKQFTFAVLDDVLMSVDSGHRREICSLLKDKFPHTQFAITTHDPIWLRHMRTEGLISGKNSIEFKHWTVEEGPSTWGDRNDLKEIEAYLEQNDIQAAAGRLRNYLEYTSKEICHRLGALVPFRGDGQYQLGDLLPNASKRFLDLLKIAKSAALSWEHQDLADVISAKVKSLEQARDAANVEQWQINSAIHYNEWANFNRGDFQVVTENFEEFLGHFCCKDCGGYLRISPERGHVESLRCSCSKVNFNLKKKNASD